jgi:hypothetical protein
MLLSSQHKLLCILTSTDSLYWVEFLQGFCDLKWKKPPQMKDKQEICSYPIHLGMSLVLGDK